jgi:hypothetical protein
MIKDGFSTSDSGEMGKGKEELRKMRTEKEERLT